MSSRTVQIISGDTRTPAQVEKFSGRLVVMNDIHANIHDGTFFTLSTFGPVVVDDAVIAVLIITPATGTIHLRATIAAGGDAETNFFEGTTVSANGTVATPINRNRMVGNVTTAQFFRDPTVTVPGLDLVGGFIPGGSGGGPGATPGGGLTTFEEFILGQNTNYLLRVTNRAGTSQPVAINLDFYDTNF